MRKCQKLSIRLTLHMWPLHTHPACHKDTVLGRCLRELITQRVLISCPSGISILNKDGLLLGIWAKLYVCGCVIEEIT